MMAAVVITNPTHFAIALQYERGMDAPICVAKGVDALALNIKEVAGEHSIPVVENPPLARALPPSRSIRRSRPSTTRRWPIQRTGLAKTGSCADGAA
jgi:flagellar biosynthetic protein FlhB